MNADRQLIEERLGYPLDSALAGSISHLNRVPEFLIALARGLEDPRLARSLLAFYVTPDARPYLDLFVQDVVFGATPAATWLRGRVLVPDFGLGDLVVKPRAALLTPIGGAPPARIVPRLTDWNRQVPWVGAPAASQPDADYRSAIPMNTVSLADAQTERIEDLSVAFRRWISARLAMDLHRRAALDLVRDVTEIASGLPPVRRWSDDALVAAEALLRERRWLNRQEHEIPGFRGPDGWYGG